MSTMYIVLVVLAAVVLFLVAYFATRPEKRVSNKYDNTNVVKTRSATVRAYYIDSPKVSTRLPSVSSGVPTRIFPDDEVTAPYSTLDEVSDALRRAPDSDNHNHAASHHTGTDAAHSTSHSSSHSTPSHDHSSSSHHSFGGDTYGGHSYGGHDGSHSGSGGWDGGGFDGGGHGGHH